MLAFVFFFCGVGFACCFVFRRVGHFSPLRLGGSASEVFTQNIAAELVKALQNQLSTVAIPASGAKMPDGLLPPQSVDANQPGLPSCGPQQPGSAEAPAPATSEPQGSDSKTPSQVGAVGTVGTEREQPEDAETIPGSPRQLSKNDIKDWDEGCLSLFGTVFIFCFLVSRLLFNSLTGVK